MTKKQPKAQVKSCAVKKNKKNFLHIRQGLTKSLLSIFGKFSIKMRKYPVRVEGQIKNQK
jgi:hypothetical protein